MAENQERKAALYVDGFNFWHPLDKKGEHWLKWVNLWKLGEILIEKSGGDETLVKVVYCSAKVENDPNARDRHTTYITALRAVGVKDLMGHYMVGETHPCKNCGMVGTKDFEKQTDINVALALLFDGIDDVYHKAFLLSADSDQAATARVFAERCSSKTLVNVIPLDQHPSPRVTRYAPNPIKLEVLDIERSVFYGPYVTGKEGVIRRPDKYEPASWWVHPNDRKRKN